MPGKTKSRGATLGRAMCFNEAPAKCRGKHSRHRIPQGKAHHASMRPQRNAGENFRAGVPPPNATARASMRPQRNAGENAPPPAASRSTRAASMRPQRNAGENVSVLAEGGLRRSASMRPQRNAGENRIGRHAHGRRDSCFNEAPAKCRGKPSFPSKDREGISRFNEAPAKCRGKLAVANRCPTKAAASMRPQRNAGENALRTDFLPRQKHGFNEAPAKCRGKRGGRVAPRFHGAGLQ